MPQPEQDKWEQRYAVADLAAVQPAALLEQFDYLLPPQGRALDLACGLGANARLLAHHGLDTLAWDNSTVAIDRLAAYARQQGLPLLAERRDVVATPPAADSFDVIVVSRFLERSLCPAIAAALHPGGLLFYQTFIRDAVNAGGPSNPTYRLERNELLRLFRQLTVLLYREEGRVGDIGQGVRDEAWLIALRPG